MKETLKYLFDHQTLGNEDAKRILRNIAGGKYNDSEIAAFISVYLMRSITVEELSGFRDALLELCTPVDLSEFNNLVFAFDNDEAGKKALRKWKKVYPKAAAILPAKGSRIYI